MRKWMRPVLLAIALMLVLMVVPGRTFAADRIHVYVDTLAELRAACAVDGNYVELSGSITADVEGFLVDITGNEVTLDLGNYKLENTSPLGEFFDSGVVRIQSADVSVISGTLAGGNRFSYGVYIDENAGDVRLERLRIKEATGPVGIAVYAGAKQESTVRVRDCNFTQMAGQPHAKRRYFVNVSGKTNMYLENVTLDSYDADPNTGVAEHLLGVFAPATVHLADVTMKKPRSCSLVVVWADDYLSIGDVAANPDVIVTADGERAPHVQFYESSDSDRAGLFVPSYSTAMRPAFRAAAVEPSSELPRKYAQTSAAMTASPPPVVLTILVGRHGIMTRSSPAPARMPSAPRERKTRCTPCDKSASTMRSGAVSPVRCWPSVRFGLKVWSLDRIGRRRSAFVTETGSAKIGTVTCSAIQQSVSRVRFPSTTTASAELSISRRGARNAGVMHAEMSVSLRASCISPCSSVI